VDIASTGASGNVFADSFGSLGQAPAGFDSNGSCVFRERWSSRHCDWNPGNSGSSRTHDAISRRYAALGLAILLLAVFPANVRAARQRLTIAGRPVPGLIPRTLLQIVFLTAAIAVFIGEGH
jgi:hypothetical protein